jgi:hypothetical protein
VEKQLGLSLPALLKSVYLQVGNGGFGPGLGLIGLKRGYASDFGTLAETYEQFKGDCALVGKEWKTTCCSSVIGAATLSPASIVRNAIIRFI